MYIKNFNLLLHCVLIVIFGFQCSINNEHDIHKNNINFLTIYLYSYDPYGYFTQKIKKNFITNNIRYILCKEYIENIEHCKHKTIVHLSVNIINVSKKYIKIALFQDGQSAGYQVVLTVIITIITPDNSCYSYNILVSKSFFVNPLTIEANIIKKCNILESMYQEASEKLIYLILNNHKKNN